MLRAQTVLRKTGARMLGGAVFCAVGAGSALCTPQRGRRRAWRECAFRKRRGAERHKGGGSAQSGGSVTGGGACFRRGSAAGERGAGGQKRPGKARMRSGRPRGAFLQKRASAKRPYVPQRWNFPAQQGDNPAAGPCAALQSGHDFVKARRPEKNFLHVF